jgi:hypothetical protein
VLIRDGRVVTGGEGGVVGALDPLAVCLVFFVKCGFSGEVSGLLVGAGEVVAGVQGVRVVGAQDAGLLTGAQPWAYSVFVVATGSTSSSASSAIALRILATSSVSMLAEARSYEPLFNYRSIGAHTREAVESALVIPAPARSQVRSRGLLEIYC